MRHFEDFEIEHLFNSTGSSGFVCASVFICAAVNSAGSVMSIFLPTARLPNSSGKGLRDLKKKRIPGTRSRRKNHESLHCDLSRLHSGI